MPDKLTRYGIRLTPVNGVWAQTMIECDDGEFVRYSDVTKAGCQHSWVRLIHPDKYPSYYLQCSICGETQ